jgi:Family of unknown function (DUF6266)
MGVLKRGILGGFSGKVGSVTGSSWKGIEVMKSRPLSVANPRTAGQTAQRDKMTNIVAFNANINAAVIKPLWDRFAVKKSGYNAFVQANIALFDAVVPTLWQQVKISMGKMAATQITTKSAHEATNTVSVDWNDDSGEGYKLESDQAFLVIQSVNSGKVYYGMENNARIQGNIEVTVDNLVLGDTLHLYLAFRRADGTVVSDTSFTSVVVAA